jgi:hypothetical protein
MGTLVGDETQLRIGAAVVGEIVPIHIDGQPLPTLRWRIGADA